MENMVIGVYDSYAQAQNAMNDLLAAGFAPDHIHLSPDSSDETPGGASAAEVPAGAPAESGIGHFFRSLLGMEISREHGDIYAEAMRRGSCVLTVHADSDPQREQALGILNRYDPVDIGERSARWRSEGWSGYNAAETIQNHGRSDGDFADSAAAATDADYRTHWENVYAKTGERYEEFDAAYRYGTNVGGSERYRNYRWEEVEPDLRSNWESQHPERKWDQVKDAVRYGAERVADRH